MSGFYNFFFRSTTSTLVGARVRCSEINAMFTAIIALLVALFALSFAAPAFAQTLPVPVCDAESQGNFVSKQFEPGSATAYSGLTNSIPGVATHPRSDWGFGHDLAVEQVGPAALGAFQACTRVCGTVCRIEVTGHGDSLRFENLHSSHNGGLAADRGGIVGAYLKANLDPHLTDIEAVTEGQVGRRFVEAKVYVATALPVELPGATAARAVKITPIDPDTAFDWLKLVVWDERNNLCPTRIWANANTREWNRTGNVCDCTQNDVSPEAGYQIYSEDAMDTWLTRQDTADDSVKSKTWTAMVRLLGDNPFNRGVEVDVGRELIDISTVDGGGIGLEVHYSGSEVTVLFPNRCALMKRAEQQAEAIAAAAGEQQAELDRLESYRLDGYARGNFVPGRIDRSELSPYSYAPGTTVDGIIEAGVVVDLGSHDIKRKVDPDGSGPREAAEQVVGYHYAPVSIMAGLMFDVGHDPDCVRPAVVGWGVVGGFAFNRAYRWSFEANGYYLRSGAPYPDGDGTNVDLQRERIGVRGGPRVSLFGEGTHAGYLGLDGFIQADFLTATTVANGMASATAVPAAGAWAYLGWDF